MALNIVLLSSLLVTVLAQYPRHVAPEPPVRSAPPPQRQRDPEPVYQVAPRHRSPVFNPAAVHYVNIGTELQGDYKFGYDTGKAGDGQSFREETRLPDGSVKGAYGYVDADGKQRIVKYTAGKDGYKAEGDVGAEGIARARSQAASQPQHAQPAPAYRAPAEEYNPPQQAYRPPPQQAYNPPQQTYSQPQPAPKPLQPVYRPPQQQQRQPQEYRPQETYNPPAPASRPARPPVYSAPPRQASRPSSGRAQQRPQKNDYEYDYDSPDNELNEPRVQVPIDTTLFNYNIGIGQNKP